MADDEAIEYTVKFVRAILKEAPTTLVTLETPKNDVFPYLPGIHKLLKSNKWQMLTASYCSCANGLDIGYWPQKDSNFLVLGVPRGSSLPMCNSNCDHLVPGTSRHQVVLCSDRRNHPGQFVIKDAMVKGVIPHGLISRIWKVHNQLLGIRAAAADRLKGSVRPGLIDARAIKQETEKSIRQRVAAYRAAAEDLGEGIQQTASKLCCMARREMREFCSQVTFANPLVTGIQTVRKDVQWGIPNLRQLVAKNRKEVCSQRQRPVVLQVTMRSAKDAELPVEEAEVEPSDEATEAPDCVPLLPVESSTWVPELEPVESEPTQVRPDVPEKEAPPGEVALWARFIAGAKPGIMVD